MIKKLLFGVLFFSGVARAQTFTGTGGTINNDSTLSTFNVAVSGMPILGASLGLKQVNININHPASKELHIYLRSPNGYAMALSVSNGNGAHYLGTSFSNSASTSIRDASAPFTGTFRPENSLAVFNTNNVNGSGNWSFIILDDVKGINAGSVTFLSLVFGSNPALPVPFTKSSLPVIVVNTLGKTITTLNDISSTMYILDSSTNFLADTSMVPSIPIGIHIRGNSSAGGTKDPYSFSPKHSNGEDSNMSILGMPSENDWILNNAFSDQSFMRDPMAFYLFNRMGRYASRTRFCELVINGEYRGLYCMMEKIKQDKDRVDISKLKETDTSGSDVTGGYILKRDGAPGVKDSGFFNTQSGYYYLYDDPDSPVIQQKVYIKSWMDSALSALLTKPLTDTVLGYRKYIDYRSAIDYIIVCELGVSGDTYGRSVYWYKHKINKGGKIYFGPVWDFNYGWTNPNNQFKFPTFTPWKKMYDDTFFKKEFWCRYNSLRGIFLNPATINAVLDSFTAPLYEAIYRNDERWFQSRTGSAVISNCFNKDACYTLKKYSYERLRYLDSIFFNSCNFVTAPCKPTLTYSLSNDTLCAGDTAILNVNSPSNSITVIPAVGVTKINKSKFRIRPSVTTTYRIIWGNCTSYDTTAFTVYLSNQNTLQCSGRDTIAVGDSVLLTVTGATWYSWNNIVYPLNATQDSVYVKPLSTYTYVATSYNVACAASVNKKITVIPKLSVSLFSSADSLCAGEKLFLKAYGGIQYTWNVNGVTYTSDTVSLYPTTDVSVKLKGYMTGGQLDSTEKYIKVFPKPVFSITSADTLCSGESVTYDLSTDNTYLWSPSTGLTLSNGNARATFAPSQTTLYHVYAVNAYGCLDSATINIVVYNKPTLNVTPKKFSLCGNETTVLYATSNGSVLWTLDSTTTVISPGTIRVAPHQSRTYYVTSVQNGCVVYDSAVITWHPKPDVQLTAPEGVCYGDSAEIVCTGADSFFIIPFSGVKKIGNSIFHCSLSTNTNYSVYGSNGGCLDTATTLIKAYQKTQMLVFPSAATYNGTTPAMIRVVGGVIYDWTPKQGLDRYDNDTVYASPTANTTYTINAIDANNCPTSSTVQVSVPGGISNPGYGFAVVIYPNPATRVFTVESKESRSVNAMIYNSIGQIIFTGIIAPGKTEIGVAEWAAGVYLVKVGSETYRLIKE